LPSPQDTPRSSHRAARRITRRITRRLAVSVLGTAAVIAATAAPLTTGVTTASAAPGGDGWNLVFSDEFSDTTLDSSKWHTCFYWAPTTCSIESNNELELYTANNVSEASGSLKLEARKQNAVAWNGKTYNYTSGMVSTGGSPYSSPAKAPGFTFTYGYVEARVKVPAGKGMWPALWLLPNDHSWPPEIDVMEIIGSKPTQTNMHYHYTKSDGSDGDIGNAWTGPDFSAGWHTFGVDWEAGSLVWYVDGVERARYTGSAVTSKASYLLLNLAVGGNWPGAPDSTTAFPADYLVDYVRVFQAAAGTSTPPTADSAAPSVKIDAISSTLGKVGIKGIATDNVGVTKVQLFIDNKLMATSSTSPLSYTWNARKASSGAHNVLVKAWDPAGNMGQSSFTYVR
ncbi:MAG TPA: family 16 glycosylhydrolase, partial [Sporichthya sp.]|nr:family 16 glycosylhydrolase [Sporichthya sp.]